MRDTHAIHHARVRYAKHKPIAGFTTLMYIVAFFGPLMTFPQVFQIFSQHSAQGVSLITWMSYEVVSGVWLMYGILHKDRFLQVTHTLWLLVQGAVLLGVLIYA